MLVLAPAGAAERGLEVPAVGACSLVEGVACTFASAGSRLEVVVGSRSSVLVDMVRSMAVDRRAEAGRTAHAWFALVCQRVASRPVAAEGIGIAGAARNRAAAVVADMQLARSCVQAAGSGTAAARQGHSATGPETRCRRQILLFAAAVDEL